MFPRFSRGYRSLQQDEEPKSELRQLPHSREKTWLLILNFVMFVFSVIISGSWLYDRYFVLNSALRRTSTWTPIHDLIDLNMEPRLVQGTLFPAENASIAREMPNLVADAKWSIWEETRWIPISKADVIKLGKNPDTAFKLEDSLWGLGDDVYAAHLDVFHQLHCLNSLREIAYGTYYNESMGNPKGGNELYEVHLNHCVDILMQALQCSGNMNLITLHWTETQPYPHPDFSINRQCVAFDRLTEWNQKNSLDRQKFFDAGGKMPEGQLMEEAPPKMREWVRKHAGEYEEHHHGML